MATAAYDSDLTAANSGELTIADSAASWDESSNAGYDDNGVPVDETNFYIQGTSCVSCQWTKTGIGTAIFIGIPITVPANGAILIWAFWASPASLNTYANGGVRTLVGNGLGAFNTYKASGSNFDPNPIGGWAQYAIDPASATIHAAVGGPNGTWNHFGMVVDASAQSRGNPFAVDAIRYGRCTLEVIDGFTVADGTFAGMATFDTSTDQRYGLFQTVFGGYKWKGLMSLGITATAVNFIDANANIFVDNVPQVSASFNRIEVNHASSVVEWTSVGISAQDGLNNLVAATASVGEFECVDNATVTKTACTFTDMGTFIYQSLSTLINTIYRRCGVVTQGGATITGCTFDAALLTANVAALTVSNLALVTGCAFTRGTLGHAVDLGVIGSTQTLAWNGNKLTGYRAGGAAGTNIEVAVPDGTEAIKVSVSSGFVLTLDVQNGADVPQVDNIGLGTVNITAGSKTLTISVSPITSGYEWRFYTVTAVGSLVGAIEIDGEESAVGNTHALVHTYASQPFAVQIMHPDYVEVIKYYTLDNVNNITETLALTVDTND